MSLVCLVDGASDDVCALFNLLRRPSTGEGVVNFGVVDFLATEFCFFLSFL